MRKGPTNPKPLNLYDWIPPSRAEVADQLRYLAIFGGEVDPDILLYAADLVERKNRKGRKRSGKALWLALLVRVRQFELQQDSAEQPLETALEEIAELNGEPIATLRSWVNQISPLGSDWRDFLQPN